MQKYHKITHHVSSIKILLTIYMFPSNTVVQCRSCVRRGVLKPTLLGMQTPYLFANSFRAFWFTNTVNVLYHNVKSEKLIGNNFHHTSLLKVNNTCAVNIIYKKKRIIKLLIIDSSIIIFESITIVDSNTNLKYTTSTITMPV